MAVMMAAAHLGIEIETRRVDLMQGEQDDPSYLKINPNGLVPTLRDGDFVLWETIAILQYICAKAGETPLWPRDDRTRADIARWQIWSLAHWTPALQVFIYQNLFKRLRGRGEADPSALAEGEAKLARYGAALDAHLANRSHAVGDELTLADISLAAYLVFCEPARIPLGDFQHVRRWFREVSTTPSWRAAHPVGVNL